MSAVRTTALIGILALALALGAIAVGHLLLIPSLTDAPTLVDANLARALSEPLALRCAEAVLAACVVLAAVSKPWLRHRVGPTLGILAAGIAVVDRLLILPALHQAWGRVDLVAMRPLARLEAAEQLSVVHHGALGALLVVLVALVALACTRPQT